MDETVNSTKKRTHGVNTCHDLEIVIIGSGVAGLATALALQQHDLHVTIYERDLDFHDRRQGYGMTLTNNLTGALAKLGLREECQAKNCPSSCHYIFDSSGSILGYYGRYFENILNKAIEKDKLDTKERFNLRIPRQDLREMLYHRLQPNTVKWGYKLIDYHENNDSIQIHFNRIHENYATETIYADILVGCDGIRSMVRSLRDQKLYSNPSIPNPCPLTYLGISVILGISTFNHPLVVERGFYVLDGIHRLFIMPYREPSRIDSFNSVMISQPRLTMWQLSFSGLSEEEAIQLKSTNPEKILSEAISRVSSWFSPVREILSHSSLEEIWATPLYDRDPMIQPRHNNGHSSYKDNTGSRVVVLGDACHPMSMFKGQGANQAMEDGPLLAKWLTKDRDRLTIKNRGEEDSRVFLRKTATRLKCFEREMIARTRSKVLSSREAARQLHHIDILHEKFGIEGVNTDEVDHLLEILRIQSIDASLADKLDESLSIQIQNLFEVKQEKKL